MQPIQHWQYSCNLHETSQDADGLWDGACELAVVAHIPTPVVGIVNQATRSAHGIPCFSVDSKEPPMSPRRTGSPFSTGNTVRDLHETSQGTDGLWDGAHQLIAGQMQDPNKHPIQAHSSWLDKSRGQGRGRTCRHAHWQDS